MKATVADYERMVLCLRIEPVDDNSAQDMTVRLTHFPRDLTMDTTEVYLSGSGFDFTGFASTVSTSPATIDFQGILGIAGITADQIASGVYDNARAYLFATDWNNPVEDEEPIVASIVGKATLIDDRYIIEEMSLVDALNQTVGDTYTASCKKKFGGQEYAGCSIDLVALTETGTITSVTSNLVFRDSGRVEAADYFGAGTIQFTSGDNMDLSPLEIKSYAANGTITLFEPFYYPVQVGDTYSISPGCRKRLEDCRDKWNNVVNFGGFSFIPTYSQYSKPGTK